MKSGSPFLNDCLQSAMNPVTPILEIQTGKLKGRRLLFAVESAVVGRGDQARIRIASPEVSRMHCRLTRQEDSVLVEDLGSRNGTFVDGRPVRGRALLEQGSTLTVGPISLRLLGDDVTEDRPSLPGVSIAGRRGRQSEAVSEDHIVSWLSDHELAIPAALTETLSETLLPEIFMTQSTRHQLQKRFAPEATAP